MDLVSTTPQTLDYELTPNGAETVLDWTGLADGGVGWRNVPVSGDNRLVGNKPVGIFDWYGDIGEGLPGATTNPSIVGSTTSTDPSSYTLIGAGNDVYNDVDTCHLAAKTVSGDFYLQGRLDLTDPGTHVWSKLGIMVRSSVDGNAAQAFEGIRNPANTIGEDVVMQWRNTDGGGSGWTTVAIAQTAPAWVRILRTGNTVSGFYSADGVTWTLDTEHTVTDLVNDEVVAGFFIVSHTDDGSGVAPGAATATGEIAGVTLAQIGMAFTSRTIGATEYNLGDVIPVTIDIGHAVDAALVIEETAPAGWVVLSASGAGAIVGNTITWTIANFTADTQLTYTVAPAGGQAQAGLFDGIVSLSGVLDVPIEGDTQLNRVGASPIIFITDFVHALQDVNMAAAMGVAGLTVDLPTPQTIPGLGYAVWELDANDPREAQPFTLADGRLIFVSHSVASGDVAYHQLEPLPMINAEPVLADDDGLPRNEMYMSTGQNARDNETGLTIVDNTHPITSIFQPGDLTILENRTNTPQLNTMTGTIGSGVIVLGRRIGFPDEPCLTLYPGGTTDAQLQTPAAVRPFTAPAARLNLPFGNEAFQYPTREGVILFQRIIQYMIGDAVTAGLPAPSAPQNLLAAGLPGVQLQVELTWLDSSNNENGFVIGRSVNGGPFIDIAEAGADATSWIDANATLSETFTYRVRAFNVSGESANSNEATADYRPRVSANATPISLLLPARESELLGEATDVISGGIAFTTWTLVSAPGASTATLASPNAPVTTVTLNGAIGTYVFEFAAIDLLDQVATATVSILLYDSSNLPPVVDAGLDQQVGRPFLEPVVATLQGSVTDPLGQPITATWSMLNAPSGANAVFADINAAQTTVTLDNIIGGQYVLRLTGDDGLFEVTDDVTIAIIAVGATSVRDGYWQLLD